MLKVYLLRHGETAYNANGNRYCGRTDIGLTEKGLAQAHRVNTLLKGIEFDEVYASPLSRARITAAIASGYEPKTDQRLIEIDFGLWEGKTKEEFLGDDPQSWRQWIEDTLHSSAGRTGEKGGEVIDRMNAFFEDMQIKHRDKTILVVAHNGVNRIFLAGQLGMPIGNYRRIEQLNSALTVFTIEKTNGFTLNMLNG